MRAKLGVLVLLVLLLGWGVPGQADIELDGIDDFVGSSLALGNVLEFNSFSVMGWMDVQGTPPSSTPCWTAGSILGDTFAVFSLGHIDLGGGPVLCGAKFDDAGIGEERITTPATDGWHHLVLTLGGGTLSLYVDGALIGTTGATNLFGIDGEIRLGAILFEGALLTGRIADPRYYDVALSAEEIRSIAESRTHRIGRTAPTAAYPLDECAEGASGNAVTFRDRSGNGRHMTGDHGANATGLTCRASTYLMYPPGVW